MTDGRKEPARAVEVKRIAKVRSGGGGAFKGAQEVAGWAVSVGLTGFVVTPVTVPPVAQRDRW